MLILSSPHGGDFLYNTTLDGNFIRATISQRFTILTIENMEILLQLFFRNICQICFLWNEPPSQQSDAVFNVRLLPRSMRIGKICLNIELLVPVNFLLKRNFYVNFILAPWRGLFV